MVKETEFYDLLSVRVDADEGEIKRSYRRLALKYHPDKNPGDAEAAERFKQISHAYETLSDADRRRRYDAHGAAGLDGAPDDPRGGFADAAEVFARFFGAPGRGPGEREGRPRDLVHELVVTLAEVYAGRPRRVRVARRRLCPGCRGGGLRPGARRQPCRPCAARGVVLRQQPIFPGFAQTVAERCGACGGVGETARAADLCPRCHGARVVGETAELEVHLEKGTRRGDVFRFSGEGDEAPGAPGPGDVLIFIEMAKDGGPFRRLGNHLLLRRIITLREALCGFELPITHLDRRRILVKVPHGQVLNPTSVWRVKQEGMPLPNTGGLEKGDLFILFGVKWPESLCPDQLDTIAKAFNLPETLPRLGGQQVTLSSIERQRCSRGRRKGEDERIHIATEASLGHKDDGDAPAHTRRGRGGRRADPTMRRDSHREEMLNWAADANEQHQQPYAEGSTKMACGHQ